MTEIPTIGEPTPDRFTGGFFRRVVMRYLLATRPMFLSASVLPVLLGSSWGWQQAEAGSILVMVVAVLAVACVHAGANVANDVADEMNGSDGRNRGRIHPYTGGSRFIQNGVLTVSQMTYWSIILLASGAVLGLPLAALRGPSVFAFGAVGIALGLAYSLPPLALNKRGLGELTVAIAFGALPVLGSYWLQAGGVALEAILLSIPVSLWITAVLVMNEIPDIEADAAAGKLNLVIRLGRRPSAQLFMTLHIVALLVIALSALVGAIPLYGLVLPLILIVPAIQAVRSFVRGRDDLRQGIIMTLAIHAAGCLWLTALPLASLGLAMIE